MGLSEGVIVSLLLMAWVAAPLVHSCLCEESALMVSILEDIEKQFCSSYTCFRSR